MVGEMKRIFCLLCLLTCVGASHAATMCVPDLSTCESCTPVSTSGSQYVVNCCGVDVSGVALFWYGNASVVPSSVSVDSVNAKYRAYLFVACYMVSPFAAPYMHIVSLNLASCVISSYDYVDIADLCMNSFKIKCALTECVDTVGCSSQSFGGAD